jgi:hypothetical protein
VEPLPPIGLATGAPFQWACRKSQLTWRGRPDAAPPGSAPPSRTFPFFPAARAGGRDARGWSGAERDAGGKARRGHRSGAPRAQTHRSSSADPPPPTPAATTTFQAFSLCPPAKIINQRPHRTGTHPTHRSTSTAPQTGERARARHRNTASRWSSPSPSPWSRTPLFRDLPAGPGVGDQTETETETTNTNAPRRAGRPAGRGRAGRDASHARRPDPDSGRAEVAAARGDVAPLASLARCLLSASVRER